MASCVWNIPTKSYQNLIIGFQVTDKNVEDAFLDTVYNRYKESDAHIDDVLDHPAVSATVETSSATVPESFSVM